MRAVAMNARVANACTGAAGLAAARAMAQVAEQAAGLPSRTALVLSTGVIGLPLPVEQVAEGPRPAAPRPSPAGGLPPAPPLLTPHTPPQHPPLRPGNAARLKT